MLVFRKILHRYLMNNPLTEFIFKTDAALHRLEMFSKTESVATSGF